MLKYISNIKWIKYFFNIFVVTLLIIFLLNILVDPFDELESNFFNLEKINLNNRDKKISLFQALMEKNIEIDNLILGSSRVIKIDPSGVSKYLGGKSFNFGVNSASTEDYLGILLFLKNKNKIPKNIILGLDFYTFNPLYINDRNLSSKNLNFLNNNKNDFLDFKKFISIGTLKSTVLL